MKNLKKVLSLVLALAMAMSLMTVAFAKDASELADYSKVSHNEAVDVVAAIDVMVGDNNGNYNPTAVLDRASAAKIVAYLTIGADAADAQEGTGTIFTDVAATHWAAGYIEYCATEGYINGVGNDKFNPYGTLTGLEFGKMLLCVLGYDAETDGLTGGTWAIKTNTLGNVKGLYDDIDGKASAALTRENAAEMILAALQAKTVTAHPGVATTVNGVTVVTGGSAATDNNVTLADTLTAAGALKTLAADTDTPDASGRPLTTWTYDGEEIGTYAATPDFTFNTAMTEKEIFAAVGAAGIQGSSDKYIVMDKIYLNGVLQGEAVETNGQYASTGTGDAKDTVIIAKNDKSNAAGFGNGVVVELFKGDDANHYTMAATSEYIGTINSIIKADEDKGIERAVKINGVGTFETESFEKGDIVLYTLDKNGIASMTAPSAIEGKVTKISNGDTYTIGGNTYVLSQNNDVTLKIGDEGSWYVDSCGNIISVKEAADADVYYGYLLAYGNQEADDADLFGNTTTDVTGEKVKFVDATGTTVVLDTAYKTDKDGKVTAWVAPDGWTSTTKNILFSYELNSKGEISKITAAGGDDVSDITVTKGDATLSTGSVALTADTVFFYVDDTNEKYAVYTGYANAPTKTGTLAGRVHDGKTYDALVLEVSDVNVESDKQYVYFGGDDVDVETTEDGDIYTYTNVYVDGKKTTLKNDGALTFTAGYIYEYTTDSDGYATLGDSVVNTEEPGTEITLIQSTYFKAGSNIYVDANTVYYEVDQTNNTIAVVNGLTALSDKDAYSVNWLYNDKGDKADNAADLVVFYVGD